MCGIVLAKVLTCPAPRHIMLGACVDHSARACETPNLKILSLQALDVNSAFVWGIDGARHVRAGLANR